MMTRHFARVLSAAVVIAAYGFVVFPTTAADLVWDPGMSGGSDGAGTWLATDVWFDSGLPANVTWTAADNATIGSGGAGGTITLGAVDAGTVLFDNFTGTYTLSGGTLTQSGGITVSSGNVTINSVISGAGAIVKSGSGTLRLTNDNNDFTGGVTLDTGDLQVETGVYDGWGTGNLTINGGRVRTASSGTFTTDNNSIWNANFGVYRGITGTAIWNHDGNVTLGGNVAVNSSNNFFVLNIAGDIGETGGSRSLSFTGSGLSVTLDGTNTYSGGTTYNTGGTLRINSASALGTGALTIASGSIDNTSGSAVTLSTNNVQNWNNNITFTGSNDLNLGTGAVTINNNRTVTVTAGTLTVGGGIGQSSGTRTLTKAGVGTLILGGANTYTGATNVNAGTLVINGSTAAGAVTVASGATLGGNGTLAGALTVSGSLAPGNSIGTLNVANDMTWNGSVSTPWVFELGPGNTADLLNITGGASDFLKGTGTGGTDFVFDFAGSTDAGTFNLVTWGGTTTFTETDFDYTNLGGGNTGTFQISGSALQFVVVPEPGTLAILGAGVALLGFRLARRRR